MKPVLLTAFALLAVAGVMFAVRDAAPARATGTGPNIELGAPVGMSVPVLATTAATDPFSGFNIDVVANASRGVALTSIVFDVTGSVLGAPADLFCDPVSPSVTQRLLGCVSLVGSPTTSAGLLATLSVAATGDGCISVGLLHVPGNSFLDTFTVNAADSSVQTSAVNVAQAAKIVVGAGTTQDCVDGPLFPPTLTPTATKTLTPTVTPTSSPTATPTITPSATPHDPPGIGPSISLGDPTGAVVPVVAGVALNFFDAFNIHVHARAGGSAVVQSVLFNEDGSALGATSDIICATEAINLDEQVLGCSLLPSGGGTLGSGPLANVLVSATGNGCVDVGLINVQGNVTLGTFTVDQQYGGAQANDVDVATIKHLIIGTGSLSDCPGLAPTTPTSTPTLTNTPTVTPTFTPSLTPTITNTPTITSTPTITPTPHPSSGSGPDIGLGAPTYGSGGLVAVPANALTTASSAFSGDNLHIQTSVGGGATLLSLTANDTGSLLNTGESTFCASQTPATGAFAFGCTAIAGQSALGPGLLATFTFDASGDGCIDVFLVTAPGDASLDTYTVDDVLETPQGNYVDTGVVHLLIGSGSEADCPISTSTSTPTFTSTATLTPTITSTPTSTPTPTPNTTPGSIATDTPIPPPGATSTATANPDDEIQVLAISPNLCLAFGGPLPVQCFDMWNPGSQQREADILAQGAPELRGCPAQAGSIPPVSSDPSGARCQLLPSDFAALAALSDNQLHADDPGVSSAGLGPWSGLYVLAFLPTDEPVDFQTSAGQFVQVNAGGGPFSGHNASYLCNAQFVNFDDCNGDGLSLKHFVVVPLGGYGATPGRGRITVSQGLKNASLDFTVVGEPNSVHIDAYRTTIGNGVADIEGSIPGTPPDGRLSGPDECPLVTTEAGIETALSKPDRTVLIARVADTAGTPVNQAWLYWSGTGTSQSVPIGPVGQFGAPITPTYDLGSFGIGAPEVLCGTAGIGTVPVTAQLFQYATGIPSAPGLLVDPDAHVANDSVNIDVTGSLATPTSTFTPSPTSILTIDTVTPAPTDTPTSTSTSLPANTATQTPVPATSTPTVVPTSTPPPTNTAVPTTTCPAVPACVATATCEATPSCLTPVDTGTPTPTATATATSISTVTPGPRVATFSLSPLQQTVPFAAGSAQVEVQLDAASDVGAFEFSLKYDPAVLRDPAIQPGPFLGSTGRPIFCPAPVVDSVLGTLLYGCASVGLGDGVTGSGVLATVTFRFAGTGTAAIAFQKAYVITPEADDACPCVVGAGATIEVVGGAGTPTPTKTAVPTRIATRTVTPPRTATVAPARTATVTPPRTATVAPRRTPTRVPSATSTRTPQSCADVTGDSRVDWRDIVAEARALLRGDHNARYDANRDGRVDVRDLRLIVLQLGRRCSPGGHRGS